jgi:hypothetical protein
LWRAQLFVEICIVIMFLGSIIGGIVQCGQIFLAAADLFGGYIPDWIQYRGGSIVMVFTTVFIFPICMVELMTQVGGLVDPKLTLNIGISKALHQRNDALVIS